MAIVTTLSGGVSRLRRPPLVGGTGGGGGGSSLPFIDTFPSNASPMLDGSTYAQGGTDAGGTWTDFQTNSGLAYTNTRQSGFNDALAIVKQIAEMSTTKHYAKITKHLAGGYTPADSHEIEALVFFDIVSSSNARGYEADDVGSGVTPVRWNGALGDFSPFGVGWGTVISGSEPNLADGDVLEVRGEIVAGNPRMTWIKNGSTVYVFEDQSAGKITTGYPGMGSFIRTGVAQADMPKISISRFEAGNW